MENHTSTIEREEDYSQDFESVAINSDIAPRKIDNVYNQNMTQKALGSDGAHGDVVHEQTINNLSLNDLRNSPHFNWTVSKNPCNDSYNGRNRRIKNMSSIVRDDTQRQLGTIKGATTLLQNKDLFDLVEPVLDSGAYSLEKAISNDGGRSVQLLMRSNNLGEFDLLPNDPAVAYLLAKVTRSGRPSIKVAHMIERLICANGMMGFSTDSITFDQKSGISQAVRGIFNNILKAERELPALLDAYREMSTFDMSNPDLREQFFRRATNLPWNDPTLEFFTEEEEVKHQKLVKSKQRTVNKIETCWEREMELAPVGTETSLTTAYQAVTRYVRHERSRNANAKQKAIYFGAGQRINNKAFSVAKDIMFNHDEAEVA